VLPVIVDVTVTICDPNVKGVQLPKSFVALILRLAEDVNGTDVMLIEAPVPITDDPTVDDVEALYSW
jgi:hypothetical protein